MSGRSLRNTVLGSVAISALALTGTANAQEEVEEEIVEVVEEVEEARQERVVITGSLIARDEFTSSSPIQIITAEVATLEGLVDTASLLQGSSIASGATQLNNTFQNFVTNGGVGTQTIDLRGCGDTRTLVLIDGKRPGPSGTRGAVSAVDLNTIPQTAVGRIEILKDGASTIYGSDAICGVVNIITRDAVEGVELNVTATQPFEQGGAQYRFSGAAGFEAGDWGTFTATAEYRIFEELNNGDRSYFECPEPRTIDPDTGELLGRLDRSARPSGPFGCSNLYHDTVLELFSGERLIPSPDGTTGATIFGGSIPGYRPRIAPGSTTGTGFLADGTPFFEDILDAPFVDDGDIIPDNTNLSFFLTSDITLPAGITWDTEFLYNRRTTEFEGFRQFFPIVGSATNPAGNSPTFGYIGSTYSNDLNSLVRPVMPYPSNGKVEVDYAFLSTSLSGGFGGAGLLSNWGWKVDATHSISDATYENNQILISRSGDWNFDGVADTDGDGVPDLTGPPSVNYLDPGFLNGSRIDELVAAVGGNEEGSTEYTQSTFTAVVNGPIFELPAGEVGIGLGIEHRILEIDDTPGELTQLGDVWGRSTAGPTRGENNVTEIFGEVIVPIFKGQPFAESLELTLSGRAFEYDVGGEDSIYKIGGNWQINPTLRVRSSFGTAYRAPALFELFLQEQTSFANQGAVDPCIEWGQSTNDNIRANCAADGIPADFIGGNTSALVVSSGGGDLLEPETSESFTAGFVFTPTFSDLSLALDYYEIQIEDEIAALGGATVTTGCYNAVVFPNQFCTLFTRNPAGAATNALAINEIFAPTLNINEQEQRGLDLEVRYERGFAFGDFTADMSVNWAFERSQQLFSPDQPTGQVDNDFNGIVGFPSVVGDAQFRLDRGDFTYTYFVDYIGHQDSNRLFGADLNQPITSFGQEVLRDVDTEAVFYHNASVRWEGDTWTFVGGIRNIFNEEPPQISGSTITTVGGNSSLNATGYDAIGRRAFVTVSKTF